MTKREEECLIEKMVAQRINAYYDSKGIAYERVNDMERQIHGIDIILHTSSGKTCNIDEKAKFRSLQHGEQLYNYSFELNRVCRDGKRRTGWFADPSNQTEVICYAFPKFNDPDDATSGIKPRMAVEYFYKRDIIDIIKRDTTMQNVIELADQLGADPLQHRVNKFNWFGLYKTPEEQLWEEPVNLLIARGIIWKTPRFKRIFV